MEEQALRASPEELKALLDSTSPIDLLAMVVRLRDATTPERKQLLRRVRVALGGPEEDEGNGLLAVAKKGRHDDPAPAAAVPVPMPVPMTAPSSAPVRAVFNAFMREIFSGRCDKPKLVWTVGECKAVDCDWFIAQLQRILPCIVDPSLDMFDAAAYKQLPASSADARAATTKLLNRLLDPQIWGLESNLIRNGNNQIVAARQWFVFGSSAKARVA
jgi:hypothetical protein